MTEPDAAERSNATPRAPRVAVGDADLISPPGAGLAPALHPIELSADLITTVDGIRALTPDYEHLYHVTGNTLPFALQEWHLTWCEYFLNARAQTQEQLRFFVLRNRSGDCVALVPLVLSRWRAGPLRLATVDVIGADPSLTEIRSPLIESGYERLVVRTVHDALETFPKWDWIQWRGVNGALAEALTAEVAPSWHRVSEDFVLDLPPSWQEFRVGLRRNVRESLRHCYNSLRRDGYSFELVVARRPTEVQSALTRFLQLHAMRARMPWGASHPDRFAAPGLKGFLYDVCGRLAARDIVRVLQLRIGSEIVASRVAFVIGDSMYLYYSGFDPAWARYSVMTTTLAEAFKYAIAGGIRTVNLSLTGEQSKRRWRPRLIEFHSALVPRRAFRARLACHAYRVAFTRTGLAARIVETLRRGWT